MADRGLLSGRAGIWLRFALGLAILAAGVGWAAHWGLVQGEPWGRRALLVAILFSGRLLVLPFLGSGDLSEPHGARRGTALRLRRPDATELHVEWYGPAGAPTLILTHGWPLDSTAWYYVKRDLGDRFRLIVWDLPGLGKSSRPAASGYGIDTFAEHLAAVLELAGPQPVILVGHSLGGMTVQKFCHLYPVQLGRRVAGIVLAHTTYTSPLATAWGHRLWSVLERPILRPMFVALAIFWPLAWLVSWLSYSSGLTHLVVRISNFAGRQTRGQIDYLAWLFTRASPAVFARGALATTAFDSREHLPSLNLPALVVTAPSDRMTGFRASLEIHRRLPRGELAVLSPAGHMGLWEQHEAFCQAVADFASRHLLSAAYDRPETAP